MRHRYSLHCIGLQFVSLLIFLSISTLCFAQNGFTQQGLPKALSSLIKKNGFPYKGIGLYIRSVDSPKALVTFQSETALNPASVIKLLTTAAALDILGAGYRWKTDVSYKGNIRDNTLSGDIYFQGNGDPYMTPERFWRLLNRISIFGVRHIKGNVYFDSSYFKPGFIDYGAFDNQPYRTYNVGPNAFLVGFQAMEFHFDTTKTSVKITPFPASPKLKIINKVKVIKGNCGRWQKRLKLSTKSVNETLHVTFSGRFSRRCNKKTLYRRVSNSNDHFKHFFLPLWQQVGGTLTGVVKNKRRPSNSTHMLEADSISISDAIRLINKYSNNVMTRQVLLTIGAQEYSPPGTTKKGIKAIAKWLQLKNIDSRSLRLDNGSGLSRKTRVSAAFLGQLLHNVYEQAYMPEFISSLPLTGYDGTMANRFKNEDLIGRAHIKTGLLDFVQSMAGYVTAANGKRYIVVLLHNHPKAHTRAATKLQDAIIRWVYNLPVQP